MEEDNANNPSTGREIYNIAPGESKLPVSNDWLAKWRTNVFPVFFPKGRFGYTAVRDIKLSPK